MLLWCVVLSTVAPRGAVAQSNLPPNRSAAEVRGTAVDAKTARPIANGEVVVQRASDSSFVNVALVQPDGTFRVGRLTAGQYVVRVRALGFQPAMRAASVATDTSSLELGRVLLTPVAQRLAGQTITAERSAMTLGLDRNVYTGQALATTAGGTAVDVLRSVPGVAVDARNQVTLLGNPNVLVQINGRASSLKGDQLAAFLAQLPSNSVRSVEVATTPSAKNDAEGTAGIVNIVLNERVAETLTGELTGGLGTTGQVNLSGNVGREKGPLKLFGSYSFVRDENKMPGSSEQLNGTGWVPAMLTAQNATAKRPLWQNAMIRSEYQLAKHDVFSADAMLAGGHVQQTDSSLFTDLDEAGRIIGLFGQTQSQTTRDIVQDYLMAWRHDGARTAPTFSLEGRFTHVQARGNANLAGTVSQGDASTGARAIPSEQDVSHGAYPTWVVKGDGSVPFGSAGKLEAGFQGTWRNSNNSFIPQAGDSASADSASRVPPASRLGYWEQVAAGYVLGTRTFGPLQAQAGLRVEETAARLTAADGAAAAGRASHYWDVFPSAVLQYRFATTNQFTLSFSRRLNRPSAYQLSPVAYEHDARNLLQGNPNLLPEYTNSVNVGYSHSARWGMLQIGGYTRRTTDPIRFVQTIDSTGFTLATYDNLRSSTQTGLLGNLTYRRGPLFLLLGGSGYEYRSNADNVASYLSVRTTVWSMHTNVSWKLPSQWDAQAFANYLSPLRLEGGTQQSLVMTNLALTHPLWAGRGSVTLRATDPFNMTRFRSLTVNSWIQERSERQPGTRGVAIEFSREFGGQIKLGRRDEPQVDVPLPVSP